MFSSDWRTEELGINYMQCTCLCGPSLQRDDSLPVRQPESTRYVFQKGSLISKHMHLATRASCTSSFPGAVVAGRSAEISRAPELIRPKRGTTGTNHGDVPKTRGIIGGSKIFTPVVRVELPGRHIVVLYPNSSMPINNSTAEWFEGRWRHGLRAAGPWI